MTSILRDGPSHEQGIANVSFFHYVCVGHFEREGEYFRRTKSDDCYGPRPFVSRRLELDLITRLIATSEACDGKEVRFRQGIIWEEDCYLICDCHGLHPHEITFSGRLVEEADCQIVEILPSRVISVEDLVPTRRFVRIGEEPPSADLPA